MESNLYPNLKPFYDSSNLEFGADTDPDATPLKLSLPDDTDSIQAEYDADLIYSPVIPSAPPLSDYSTSRSLLHTLQSYIMDSLKPPPYSLTDPLSDTDWEDDITPDYDLTVDYDNDNDNDLTLHGLDAEDEVFLCEDEDFARHNADTIDKRNILLRNDINNINTTTNNTTINNNSNNNVNATTQTRSRSTDTPPTSTNGARDMIIVRNKSLEKETSTRTDPSSSSSSKNPDNDENKFSAWVTWRKNVNRQLATVILLRKGGRVHLQKVDLSRKPLSKSSIDYVIKYSKTNASGGNVFSTSLMGRPYIMYGIPRAVLAKPSPPKRT